MAQSPMISIPKKKTDEVDWTTPIRSVILHSYGENPDTYSPECANLQRYRQDAVRGAGSDITARDLLYKYFGQLELLELRFSEIKVTFPWHDAFTSKLTTQTSLAFEKASIIFQIASTHSSIAASQNRSDPEGLKRAFHFFRTSAGMLTYINDNFLHAPSTDLSREVVKFLVGLMLAQATEVILEKIVAEKKQKEAFISKVASQASFLYSGLVEEVKEFYGKNVFDRNWVTLLQIKAKYFTSLMHYHRYLADTSASHHGDALSRIGLAETLSKDANKLATLSSSTYFLTSTSSSGPTSGTLPVDADSAILELTASLSTLTAERKTEATRDNDLIYNAIPTASSALPPVEKLVVATPIPIQEVYGTPDVQKVIGPDLFGRLIPLSVHKSASIYSEEKAKLIRGEVEKCEVADESLSAALSTFGLPTALQKWKEATRGYGAPNEQTGSDVIPQEVYDWGEEMMDADGIEDVESAKSQLATLRTSVGETLDSIGRDLESESRECEAMRVKYEHLWTQDPSASFTRAFRADLKNHLEAYNAASSSDNQLVSLWESALPEARLVLSGTDNVERLFVEQERRGGSNSSQPTLLDLGADEANEKALVDIKNRVKEIDEKLERLNKIVRERGEVIRDLKEKIQSDDVSHLLLLNQRSSNVEPALFATELEKFRPYQARIAVTIRQSEVAIEEIGQLWRSLKTGRGRDLIRKAEGKDKRKENLVSRLIQSRDSWIRVREGFKKGKEFYRELDNLAKTLKRNVDDFVRARTSERETLASQAETKRRLATPAAPLPLPEKPQAPHLLLLSPSSAPTPSWASRPPPPPSHPAPSPQPSYSQSFPPPPNPRQASHSNQESSPYAALQMPQYGLPPPPSQRPQYLPSAPTAPDPYSTLFNTPGLSSQFALDSYNGSLLPQPQGGIYPPPPTQQYHSSQGVPSPPLQPPLQQYAPYQSQPLGPTWQQQQQQPQPRQGESSRHDR
ncbi:hypothetical protein BS47DRAFT_1341273 [Hydnum rufescens UP504]|uniref:BRO domain-containing protein 1 n=1 Tax=Hydnum rufescens UP504 TaxID=1448309 RepID=A0A9P6B1W0_9AGAM|nr:hypothetical protein BS47DRAFT_1341273 [Hydnum rufescens UP504]